MRRLILVSAFVVAAAVWALEALGAADAPKAKESKMKLESPAFKDGAGIPKKHTGFAADVSPELKWTGAPEATKEFALTCVDPDGGHWLHWLIYAIPATTMGLKEGVAKTEKIEDPKGAIQGRNDFKKLGWGGPNPPKGSGVHHYIFTLYALDSPVGLAPGATRQTLEKALQGHVLAETKLIGTYEVK